MKRKKRRQLKALRHLKRAQRRPVRAVRAHRPAARRPRRRPAPRRRPVARVQALPAVLPALRRASAALLALWSAVRRRASEALRSLRATARRELAALPARRAALAARLAVLLRCPGLAGVPAAALVLALLPLLSLLPLTSAPPRALVALRFAYPSAILAVEPTRAGWGVVYFDGSREAFSDGLALSFDQRVDRADPASVLSQAYPFGPVALPAPAGQEPGRLRDYPLLAAAYGASPDEVLANLETVEFCGKTVRFNRRNGAAAALRQVAAELMSDPAARAYVLRLTGEGRAKPANGLPVVSTWNWRPIAATQRLSPHSFGIAIDLNDPFTTKEKYWLWARREHPTFRNGDAADLDLVPWPVVECFERHGFIWGGKWHHFDTMHFEYRPEFQLAAAGKRPRP